jgi:CubicO group peptidase (beta-lactamase class C family)
MSAVARMHTDRLDRLTTAVQSRIDAKHIPGVVILLARNDEVIYQQALGMRDPARGTAMTMDTIFRIYSMTKPIVSVAIMMLVEEGHILISDPVAKYFPALERLQVGIEKTDAYGHKRLELVPAQRPITIHDLLRHTSGFTYGIFGDSLVKAEYRKADVDDLRATNDQLVRKLAVVPLAHQPGTMWEYSRSTDVLGALIERLSGQPLDTFLEQRILKPLGMADSGFWVPPAKQDRLAEAFALDPDTGNPIKQIDVRSKPPFLSGGGGMVSTVSDYLRFLRMLYNEGCVDGMRLLSRKTVRYMTSDHLAALPGAAAHPNFLAGPGYGFGLGFAVRTLTGTAPIPGSVGDYHWSGLGGTYFWIDPQEKLIALWMMQAPEQRAYYRQLYRNMVYAALE